MKSFFRFSIAVLLVLSMTGCVPKSQIVSEANETLSRIDTVCNDISSDVEKLDDEYTTGQFEKIKSKADEYREILDNGPKYSEAEDVAVALSRLEKELGSIKVLAGE